MTMEQEEQKKKQRKKKILFIGLGTITTGVLGFFGWQWWRSKTVSNSNAPVSNGGNSNTSVKTVSDRPAQDTNSHRDTYSPPSGNSGFPLKKGSRGAKVKALQQALINKYGASILPRYGADGDFGNEVKAALAKEGLPSEIDESTYNALVGGASGSDNSSGGGGNSSIDAKSVSDNLYNAIDNSDFDKTMAALKQMNSVDDYKAVNKEFETHRFWFVRKTIVTALLDTFTDESQKVKIRLELIRIGLKYDGNKFSLSGLPYKLITSKGTQVMDKDGKITAVASNVLLGNPIGIRDGWVYFFPFNAEILLRVKKSDVIIQNNN